ncbi:hypothetical protein Golomagni_00004 [Golovinomyces magnicellulatus]|nr:hypothetical protein Golomagni_00004 [Golovinomyces magnicellulatus]
MVIHRIQEVLAGAGGGGGDIINLFSFDPSIPLYLLSIALGLGVIPVVCMSGKKLVGKIVEAMVKGATILAGAAA